jgi:plasmid stability protein
MAELILTDLHQAVLHQLEERAARHGRTLEEEAKAILADALQGKGPAAWAQADAIYHRLAASGRSFSDSADLLREDRDR